MFVQRHGPCPARPRLFSERPQPLTEHNCGLTLSARVALHNSSERSEGTRVVKRRSACATILKRLPGVEGENKKLVAWFLVGTAEVSKDGFIDEP